MKDFFVSYNKADRTWAEWIAWQLEAAGYEIVIQGVGLPSRLQLRCGDGRGGQAGGADHRSTVA